MPIYIDDTDISYHLPLSIIINVRFENVSLFNDPGRGGLPRLYIISCYPPFKNFKKGVILPFIMNEEEIKEYRNAVSDVCKAHIHYDQIEYSSGRITNETFESRRVGHIKRRDKILPLYDKVNIRAKLEKLKVNPLCHKCGHDEYNLLDGTRSILLEGHIVMPTVITECDKCGALCEFLGGKRFK